MVNWIKKWYDYYLMRYRFRKGKRYIITFKISLLDNKISKAYFNAKAREIEIKYMYPLDFIIKEGYVDDDFITNLRTIKIELKLKR